MKGTLIFLIALCFGISSIAGSYPLYHYHVRGRTLTALQDLSDQYAGILLRAKLVIQDQQNGMYRAYLENPEYAQIHANLTDGVDSHIPEEEYHFQPYTHEKPHFEFAYINGVIKQLRVERNTPNYTINLIKSILSQFQVDLQGQNVVPSHYNQISQQYEHGAHFKTMEDTVTGQCETLYDVLPIEDHILWQHPEVAPYPHLGQIVGIVKVKNYSQCNETMGYHFGLPQVPLREIYSNNYGDFLSKSSVSNIYVSRDSNDFLVQSAVTTNKIVISPLKYNNQKGVVVSRMNVTLFTVQKDAEQVEEFKSLQSPVVLTSLVYSSDEGFHSDRLANFNEEYARMKQAGSVNINIEWNHGRDSASSESSSEYEVDGCKKTDNHKPRPSINGPAENSFLPMFIGNKGESIKNKINIVKTVVKVIAAITKGTEHTTDISKTEILSRYTTLIKLLRLTTIEELKEIDSEYAKFQEQSTPKHLEWKVFRDAVAQSGTGPALLLINQWINSKRIQGEEAAQVISSIPYSATYPTEEYIRIFYKLCVDRNVREQAVLNDTAILSFTELIRMAYINTEESYARYPVESFQIFASHETRHRFVANELIPYLSQQLKDAVHNKDNHKVQVFIRALGNIADIKVLSVFKPYLEGEEQMSQFHRLLMVVSMDQLAKINPKVTRYALYKMILNTAEEPEIRVTAVYQLMQTRPSADMLQGLAKLTYVEPNKHVRSAIKSALENASKLQYEWTEFARNARAALKMLKRETYGAQYTQSYLYDYVVKHMSLQYRQYMQKVHSEDNVLPNYIYYSLYLNQGGLSRQYMNFVAMVSSIRSLTNAVEEQWKHPEQPAQKQTSQWAEKVAKLLNITMGPQEKVQLNVLTNIFGAKRFVAFDHTIINQVPALVQNLIHEIKKGSKFNWTKLYNEEEITISFPTESGFPFVYTYVKPSIVHFGGKVALRKSQNWELSHQFRFIHASKVETKVGFVTPHDGQVYFAGYDRDIIVNLPFDVTVKVNPDTPRLNVQIAPSNQEYNQTMVHYSAKPYTTISNVFDLEPIYYQPNTIGINGTHHHREIRKLFGDRHGIAFSAKVIGEQILDYHWLKQKFEKYGILAPIMAVLYEETLEHSEVELTYVPELSQARSINISIEYMSKQRYQREIGATTEPTVTTSKPTTQRPTISTPGYRRFEQFRKQKGWEVYSENEQKHLVDLMENALIHTDEYASGNALAITMELDGNRPLKYVAGLACSISKLQNWGRQIVQAYRVADNDEQSYFVDVAINSQATQPSIWNFIDAVQAESRLESNVEITYGQKNVKPAQVNMNVTWYKSHQRREALLNSSLAHLCKQQMKQNFYKHPACANVTAEAARIDRVYVQVDYEGVGNYAKNLSLKALNTLHHIGYDYLDENFVNASTTEHQQSIQMIAQFEPEQYRTVDVVIKSPQRETHFRNVRVHRYIRPFIAFRPGVLPVRDFKAMLTHRIESKPFCVLEHNSLNTFNNRTFPVELGACHHVLVHADQQQPNGIVYTVLARDSKSTPATKDVKIIYGRKGAQKEIDLLPSTKRPLVHISGKEIDIWSNNVYHDNTDHSIAVRISPVNGSVLEVKINDDLIVHYDSFRANVQLSDCYYGATRGICGTNNGQPAYDFIVPRNCLMHDYKNFTASYAIADGTCQGPAKEQYYHSLEAPCAERTVRPHKVVSEHVWDDAETSLVKPKKPTCSIILRTSYVSQNDKTDCFTIKSVPTCSKGCKPKETKEKIVELHCLRASKVTELYRKQIEKGANPSFAGKKVTKEVRVKVPVKCVPKN